jgi:hypothetical protein
MGVPNFRLADQPPLTALRFGSSGGVVSPQNLNYRVARRVQDAQSFLVVLWCSC